ncbi:MAG: HEPN domain-containing protein [Nanoarchaeota archaeon]
MIDDKRIEEAKNNFARYIEEALIRKTTNKVAKEVFQKNAKDSLRASQILSDNDIPLWSIVSSYYAMFYMANAVLLRLGYKTGDKIVHKVTADALIYIVRPKLKNKILEDYEEIKDQALQIAEVRSDELVQNFDRERNKRNTIQYQTTKEDIRSKAKTSLKRAKEFLFEMENLLR